jgi:hypothetical protein
MPNRDGTGPRNRGFGQGGYGRRRGNGRGLRDGSCQRFMNNQNRPAWLESRKADLENRLNATNNELENL